MNFEKLNQIKPVTSMELAELFDVSKKTLLTWLRPIKAQLGERRSKYFTVLQLQKIYAHIGNPNSCYKE